MKVHFGTIKDCYLVVTGLHYRDKIETALKKVILCTTLNNIDFQQH